MLITRKKTLGKIISKVKTTEVDFTIVQLHEPGVLDEDVYDKDIFYWVRFMLGEFQSEKRVIESTILEVKYISKDALNIDQLKPNNLLSFLCLRNCESIEELASHSNVTITNEVLHHTGTADMVRGLIVEESTIINGEYFPNLKGKVLYQFKDGLHSYYLNNRKLLELTLPIRPSDDDIVSSYVLMGK